MDPELKSRLDAQDEKLREISRHLNFWRKYFIWKSVLTFIFLFLPLLASFFAIPWFLRKISSMYVF